MVTNVGSFGRSGVHDFLLVRATGVILALYFLYLMGFIAFSDVTYQSWRGFFSLLGTQAFTLIALTAMLVHAWIGLWQVLTDYVKPPVVRLVCQFILNVLAFFYLATGVVVIWGV
jgi:succinate dehydrogenase / fumarate reductase membrane anchor subunit